MNKKSWFFFLSLIMLLIIAIIIAKLFFSDRYQLAQQLTEEDFHYTFRKHECNEIHDGTLIKNQIHEGMDTTALYTILNRSCWQYIPLGISFSDYSFTPWLSPDNTYHIFFWKTNESNVSKIIKGQQGTGYYCFRPQTEIEVDTVEIYYYQDKQ